MAFAPKSSKVPRRSPYHQTSLPCSSGNSKARMALTFDAVPSALADDACSMQGSCGPDFRSRLRTPGTAWYVSETVSHQACTADSLTLWHTGKPRRSAPARMLTVQSTISLLDLSRLHPRKAKNSALSHKTKGRIASRYATDVNVTVPVLVCSCCQAILSNDKMTLTRAVFITLNDLWRCRDLAQTHPSRSWAKQCTCPLLLAST